jgi:hypothetical protein
MTLHFPSEYAKSMVVLVAGVMRGLKRVVALPNPKDIEFPQPLNCFVNKLPQVQ